ncbi:unnamed protein product, partial [Mesorhabditis belari]|uniref:Uncharacterized protein n=1 Tax=Mesorhabditis belari TaxID=2138241 RepID=A0AAF3EPH8_9BILA
MVRGSWTDFLQPKSHKTMNNASTKFSDNYDVKEELGKGAFSVVRRCVHKSTCAGIRRENHQHEKAECS